MKPDELIGKDIEIQLTDIIEVPENWLLVLYNDEVWFKGVIKKIKNGIVHFKVDKQAIIKIELDRVKYIDYDGNKYKFIPLLTYTKGRLIYGDFQLITA